MMEGYLGQMDFKDMHPDQYNGRLWNKQYIVDQSSMKDGTPIWGNFISCYTDGSLIQQRAGWGYLVLEGSRILQEEGSPLPCCSKSGAAGERGLRAPVHGVSGRADRDHEGGQAPSALTLGENNHLRG